MSLSESKSTSQKHLILISGSTLPTGFPASLGRAIAKLKTYNVHFFDDIKELQKLWKFFKYSIPFRLLRIFFQKSLEKKFLEEISRLNPKFILIIKGFLYSQNFYKKIKRDFPATKLIYFNPDNSFNNWHFGNSSKAILRSIPLYDLHLLWGDFLKERTYSAGAKKISELKFAFDEEIYKGFDNKEKFLEQPYDVTFVGSWDKERENLIKSLLGFKILIWGNGWEKSSMIVRKRWSGHDANGPLFKEICMKSKINLNFVRKQNIPAHNMRSFEVFGLGGFMISTFCEELNDILPYHKETSFSSIPELKERLNFYLNEPEKRNQISAEVQQCILKYHTYNERAKDFLEYLSKL